MVKLMSRSTWFQAQLHVGMSLVSRSGQCQRKVSLMSSLAQLGVDVIGRKRTWALVWRWQLLVQPQPRICKETTLKTEEEGLQSCVTVICHRNCKQYKKVMMRYSYNPNHTQYRKFIKTRTYSKLLVLVWIYLTVYYPNSAKLDKQWSYSLVSCISPEMGITVLYLPYDEIDKDAT